MIGLIEFARTKGAKDKKKRKSRVSDIGLGASSIGAIGLGLGSRNSSNIDKKAKDYDAARKAQNIRREMLASQVKSNESPVRSAGLSDMPDKYDLLRRKRNRYRTLMDDAIPGELSQTQVTKNINKDVTRKKRALHKAVKNKKLASYGAIGLAGLSALELGRRGINKYRNRTKDMS